MNGGFPFRVAFVVCCILLALGYLLLQVRLRSGGAIQIQTFPLQATVVSEPFEPDESPQFSSPTPGLDQSK